MNLEKLKKIGAAVGPWYVKQDEFVIEVEDVSANEICRLPPSNLQEAKLIAEMRNHFDALLDVAEAARDYSSGEVDLDGADRQYFNLISALKKLEEIN